MKKILILALVLCSLYSYSQTNTKKDSTKVTKEQAVHYVTQMPYLPNCKKERDNRKRDYCTRRQINLFIAKNFVVPKEAAEKSLSGTTYLAFTVNKKGKVVNVRVLKGISPIVDKACIAVVKKLPRFQPGRDADGNSKPVKYQIPIRLD